MRDRLRFLGWIYFTLAGACLFGAAIDGWTQFAFLAVALWCADNRGRILEHLNPTDVAPSNVRPMVSKLNMKAKLRDIRGWSAVSERKAAKERR